MPHFTDEQELYEIIGGLFREVGEDSELGPKFRRANTIVQYQYRNPDAQITVRMREDEPPVVDCGPTALDPEVVMSMDADIAHRFWLGEVNVTVALARGQIRARGPVAKILKLLPLTKPIFPLYRAKLGGAGRPDIPDVRGDGAASRHPAA